MISLKKVNLIVAIVASINTLTVASFPVNSQSSRRTLQALPDGIYFYSNARLPKQPGSEYIILRKRGRSFIDYGYAYQSDSGCGAGTIRGNTLNTTREYVALESDQVRNTNRPINLNEFQQLASRHISGEDREGLRFCINMMSR
ncbi:MULTISPECIES: hypothetical protein [Aerosakkonema]|uniref:hypothetical protein n=1 Tax=Aerosakkonema TaxID=1246629 RepID=UPI0035B72EA2